MEKDSFFSWSYCLPSDSIEALGCCSNIKIDGASELNSRGKSLCANHCVPVG